MNDDDEEEATVLTFFPFTAAVCNPPPARQIHTVRNEDMYTGEAVQ